MSAVLGNIILGVHHVVYTIGVLFFIIIVVGALLSWVQPNPYNPIVRFIYNVTEPIYRRIRRIIPTRIGGFDFAPVLLMLVLIFLRYAVLDNLLLLAYSLKSPA